jgi:hypothetical protein
MPAGSNAPIGRRLREHRHHLASRQLDTSGRRPQYGRDGRRCDSAAGKTSAEARKITAGSRGCVDIDESANTKIEKGCCRYGLQQPRCLCFVDMTRTPRVSNFSGVPASGPIASQNWPRSNSSIRRRPRPELVGVVLDRDTGRVCLDRLNPFSAQSLVDAHHTQLTAQLCNTPSRTSTRVFIKGDDLTATSSVSAIHPRSPTSKGRTD